MNDHEAGFLQFVLPPQQRRLRTLLELGEKRRREVRSLLHHAINLNSKYTFELRGNEQFSNVIETKLRAMGAPDECYVLGGNSEIDGHFVRLADALSAVVGSGDGVFVSCLPGKLGYFEYESTNGGQILHRSASVK